MSGTMYRPQRPGGLMELLAQAMGGPPQAAAPPPVQAPATDMNRARLLDMLFAQPDIGPAPAGPNESRGDRFGSSLADALTTYASSIAQNPGLRTDFLGQFQDRADRARASVDEYTRLKAGLGQRQSQDRARYELGRMDKSEDRAADIATADANYGRKREDEKTDLNTRLTAESDEARRQREFEADQQEKRLKSEEMQARIREGTNRGDKYLTEQGKLLGEAYAEVNAMADATKELFLKGFSPSDIRTKLRRRMAELRLGPEASMIIESYMHDELENDLQLEEYNRSTDEATKIEEAKAKDLAGRAGRAEANRSVSATRERSFGATSRGR